MTQAVQKMSDVSVVNEPEIVFTSDNYASGVAILWQLKMVLKIVFSYLPIPYSFWKSIGLFQHGDVTAQLPNLQKCFLDHVDFYKEDKGGIPEYCLELGPGDSVGHALSAYAAGIKGLYLFDADDYACRDPEHYKEFRDYLVENGVVFKDTPPSFERDDVLKFTNSKYMVNGVSDMHSVPSDHLDLSFSHAVLEHVRRDDFQPYMDELYRCHKSGSVSRHWVDLHDHLGGALNSFRFSKKLWEGKSIGQAGFYTNRLTMNEMIACAQKAGFDVELKRIVKWKEIPTAINDMNSSFQDKTEEELNVCTFLMVMRKL